MYVATFYQLLYKKLSKPAIVRQCNSETEGSWNWYVVLSKIKYRYSFTHFYLDASLSWLASCFPPRNEPSTHWTGGCWAPAMVCTVLSKRILFPPAGIRTSYCSASSQSLYSLRCPCSIFQCSVYKVRHDDKWWIVTNEIFKTAVRPYNAGLPMEL